MTMQGIPGQGAQQKAKHWWTNVKALNWLRVAQVLHKGSSDYEDWDGKNHARIDWEDHLNHAMTHLMMYRDGDRSEDHLAHAVCRALFVMDTEPVAFSVERAQVTSSVADHYYCRYDNCRFNQQVGSFQGFSNTRDRNDHEKDDHGKEWVHAATG